MSDTLVIPPFTQDATCGASIVPPPAGDDATVIVNDGWYPDVSLADLRRKSRIRESVTPERLREVTLNAIVQAAGNLAAWRRDREGEGAATLAAVQVDGAVPMIGGESRFLILYRRAVYAWAKADLVERYRDVDLTGAGQRQVDELDAAVGELRRDAVHAVRDMLGRPHVDVELI